MKESLHSFVKQNGQGVNVCSLASLTLGTLVPLVPIVAHMNGLLLPNACHEQRPKVEDEDDEYENDSES